jgi:hypothetical protein
MRVTMLFDDEHIYQRRRNVKDVFWHMLVDANWTHSEALHIRFPRLGAETSLPQFLRCLIPSLRVQVLIIPVYGVRMHPFALPHVMIALRNYFPS